MSDLTNDNDRVRGPALREPDAHGHAAMLLVESLIHGLIERSVITVADAVGIVEVATDVKAATGADIGDPPATLAASVTLLTSIGDSLRHDLI